MRSSFNCVAVESLISQFVSSAAKKRDSNLLFASSSSSLKIYFLDTQQLASFTAANRLLSQSVRQQQRGEILICFRSIVKWLLKNS
ncbi:MAG: hypothetical protein JF617_09825 [Burkholderiales bacterium]|nr:hypothetical protein [Burkholderiales bacterium]